MASLNVAHRGGSKSSLLTVNRLLEPRECYKSPFHGHKDGPPLLTRHTSSLSLRRRHTIQEGIKQRSESKKSIQEDLDEHPAAELKEKAKDMDCVAIKLALRYKLMLSEVKNIIREFLEAKRDTEGGISRPEFDKVMARIFDVPSVKESVSQGAYDASAAPDGINIEEFLSWYVQNMFTQVNGMNADSGKRESETLVYTLASKFNVPVATVDKMKTRFDSYDLDGNGTIEFVEFKKMFCQIMKVSEVNQDRLKRFWEQIKKTGNVITFEEFVAWHSKYYNPAGGASDDFDPAAPLRKFYEAYDPTVQRRTSFANLMAKSFSVHT
jgi:Ca2+-binding EF-hand superfamily protein|mmetsp:Transcript_57080/g.90458  ORF Transcript_57080/g.90458 Transcript_57080/m.90458 type:complete len:324 (-) Transcript_57080:123-1094(-)